MDNIITIPNIEEYTQQIINNNLVLTRIEPYISEIQFFQKNLKGSKILECKIMNEILDIKKYKKLLIRLYFNMNKQTILQNTILNISEEEINDKGFDYYESLDLYIQGSDARRTLKEIINIIKIKNSSMELKIRLKNDEIIRFKI